VALEKKIRSRIVIRISIQIWEQQHMNVWTGLKWSEITLQWRGWVNATIKYQEFIDKFNLA